MKLSELITKIQDHELQRSDLEQYRDQLSALYSKMCLEMAEILKEKALFIDNYESKTDIEKKRKWSVTPHGQREIELKNYLLATKEMLSSLRSRIYDKIYD